MKKTTMFVLVSIQCGLLQGCFLAAYMKKQEAINAGLQQQVYDKSCKEIFPTVRQSVFSTGLAVTSADDTAGLSIETDWGQAQGQTGGKQRLMIQGSEPTPGKCTIQVQRATMGKKGEMSSGRAFDFEYQLLQAIEPEKAASLEQEAERVANAG